MLKNGFTEAVGMLSLLLPFLKQGKTYKKPENPGAKLFSAIETYVWRSSLRKMSSQKKVRKSYAHTNKYTPLQGCRSWGPRGHCNPPPNFGR